MNYAVATQLLTSSEIGDIILNIPFEPKGVEADTGPQGTSGETTNNRCGRGWADFSGNNAGAQACIAGVSNDTKNVMPVVDTSNLIKAMTTPGGTMTTALLGSLVNKAQQNDGSWDVKFNISAVATGTSWRVVFRFLG